MKKIKIFSAVLAAIILSMSSFAVYAEPDEMTEPIYTEPNLTITTETEQTLPPFPQETINIFPQETTTTVNENLLGNAGLIENQQIVFQNDLITFISVSTKGGNIFYILIDHRIEDQEANVFFLSKVNEYDLLSIIYEQNPQSGEETQPPPQHPYQGVTGQAVTTVVTNSDGEEVVTVNGTIDENSNKSKISVPFFSWIILGVVILGVIGLVIYLKMSGDKSPKHKNYHEDEELLTEDYEQYEGEE